MKKRSLLIMLLVALFVPLAMNAQTRVDATVDFETGSISELSNTFGAVVTNDATFPWVVTTANNHTTNGTYCIKSSIEGQNSQTSSIEMEVIFDQAGSISFYCWASCESATSNWDYGMFYIDGVQQGSNFLHVTDWVYQTYNVAVGTHVFKWTYRKDSSAAGNDDCFYVDDIYIDGFYIPACPKPTGIAVNNPTAHGATVSWTGTSDSYIVMVAEPVVNASYDFETGSMPSAFTNDANRPWTVVANTHSGAYCAKSANGFTSTNSDLELTVNLATAGSVNFSALVSSESGWDYGRFLIDGAQEFESSGTSNSWADYSYPLTAGSHTLTWRYYKDGSGNNGDDCFYVDDIVIKSGPSSWYEYPNATSPYTIYDATNIDPTTDYMVQVVGVCSGEQSDPSAAVSFTTLESCPIPTGLALTTDGSTMTATWDANADIIDYNVSINGTVYPNATNTNSYTFNVNLSTTYTVSVEANCTGSETSGYCNPVSATTPPCVGGHVIEYVLTDTYGDSWNGNAIIISDACGNTTTLANENLDGTTGEETQTGSLNLCESYYQFTWQSGSYPDEVVFTLIDNGTVIYSNQGGSSLTGGQVLYTIGTIVPTPTSLTAGTPGTNSVVLNWIAGGSETAWQICINNDEANLITANTNVDYTLSNLDLDTEYTVKVRAYINANSHSCWSNAVSFTTEASNCPKPTNVTGSNISVNSAHISWDGNADSYNVKYATATVTGTTYEQVFFDDFENGLDNWTTYANDYDNSDLNWHQYNATSFSGVSNHSGSYGAVSRSWTNGTGDQHVDNWLVTPQMTLGDVVKFWVHCNEGFEDSYAVYVSTGTNAVGDFTMVSDFITGTGSWEEKEFNLSEYAGQPGYVAIRHKDFAHDYLLIDDFGVYITVNDYSYGTFTTLPPTSETSCDVTGLSPETLYAVQVQADCGGTDGTSGWSSVYFTTPDACSAPTDLVTSSITSTSATLGWSDNQESYNVQYRKVYFHEGFESETLPTGWTTIDANEDGNTWYIGYSTAHTGSKGACNLSYIYNTSGTEPDDYLVSPQLDLQGTLRVWLSGNQAERYQEHFEILLSITENSVADFTTTLVAESTTTNSYVEYTADLSSYAGQQGYIAIHHFNCTDQNYLYVDDFGLYGSEDWVSVNPNPTEATTTLTGLQPNTGYEWQVQGLNCNTAGSATDWSALATFTTPEIPAVLVESISASDINMLVGATATITPTVLPADATNPTVTYTSADATIATVDANGLVTGVAAGNTTITIAATDGSNVTATINVSVANIDVTEITASDVTMLTGETATISYTVTPNNATDASVTFTSANTAIATVDASGVVTGVAIGTTTITIASVSNPEVTAEITVSVTPDPNAVQFTLVAPAYAASGDTITVEAYLAAPTSGNYDGFTGLVLGIQFDTDAFAVYGNPTAGPVATASTMSMPGLPNENHPDLVQYSLVMIPGNPNTTTGLVFSAQFTVLEEVEFGDYTFTPEVTNGAANFIINMSNNPVQIPYEVTPSTVTIGQTFTKTIEAVGNENWAEGKGGYYLIASPLADEVDPSTITDMTTGDYDLYSFDQEQDLEWQNYREHTFDLVNGQGYLYANKNGVDLTFVGVPYSGNGEVILSKTSDGSVDFQGWNLVGNPFGVDAYINKPFYTLENSDTYTENTAETAIHAMQGLLVVADNDGETLNFTEASGSKVAKLNMNVSKGHSVVDHAIISFSEGQQLPKLQFRKGSTKVYIPQDGKDYAIVSTESMGTMPVNFKAESNGIYTLSFTSEEVSFGYLHLIDNMTGIETDLLATPSYSFEARTTDYESRFKLVFATGNNANDDTFAFFSNGSFVINNEGEATLQVIDVNGRILKNESINGCANVNVNAAAGIYMLRLVNGENVKVQKVVVK